MSCYYDLYEYHKGMRATIAPVPYEIYQASDRHYKGEAYSRLSSMPLSLISHYTSACELDQSVSPQTLRRATTVHTYHLRSSCRF